MPIETTALLTLTQWLSPAYPVGAFSYSHGLEWAIDSGGVQEAATLRTWIEDVLEHGTGRADALFLAAAYRAEAAGELARIDATCRAFAASRERLAETALQGAAFARTTAGAFAINLPALCYPVAVGGAARRANLPQEMVAAVFLQAFVSNLVAVGQRLLPVGQTEAQALIHDLAPLCDQVATDTRDGNLGVLSGTAFLAEIAAMRHETQHSRIFRT